MESTKVSFTAKDVMTLRQKTGMGMMDCKKALAANNGDPKAAEEWLRERVKGKMEERTERVAGEGRIGIAVDGAKAAMVEVRTETDFTAKNEDFVKMVADVAGMALSQPAGDVTADDAMSTRIDDMRLTTRENMSLARGCRIDGGSFGKYVHHDGKRACLLQVEGSVPDDLLKGICQHIVFHDPLGISEDDVPAATLDEIRAEAIQQAKDTGKNDEIAQKIAEGKVRKYLEERTLLHQKYVLDESKTVKELLPSDAKITRFVRYTLGAD
ncbi:MAG: translation elongation factor Ts [Phycisphaerales bacterium]|nr:translation elongation factor Ts [Phycisphaerae bacterium]NNF42442.1 translation elongation factor Ts [Phycisphaerales bacterium]NNM24727.1 translation elongation factor Ts [Phycisphaerales bacterium]